MLALLLCLLFLLAGWLVWGCSGDSGESAGGAGGDQGGPVDAALGEQADLGGVLVVVSSLAPTSQPTLPDSTLAQGASPLPPGSVLYQARLLVTNQSAEPAWLDPRDFTLLAGDRTLYIDPTRSGPRPRALLPTASLNMVLTFPGPDDLPSPVLEFRPAWYAAGLQVESAPSSESGSVTAAA